MLTLCPSCRSAVDVPPAGQPRTYQCPLCQSPFVVGAVVPASPVVNTASDRQVYRPRPPADSGGRTPGRVGWVALYAVALALVGGAVMKKFQSKPHGTGNDSGQASGQTVEGVIGAMRDADSRAARVARETKLRELLDARRASDGSIDESLRALAQHRLRLLSEREKLASLYALVYFENDEAAGKAMVDVNLMVIDGEVTRLRAEKQVVQASMEALTDELKELARGGEVRGNVEDVPGPVVAGTGWRFKMGEKMAWSRLWPEMRKHPNLKPWLEQRSLENEEDFAWYLLTRESGRGGPPEPLPAVLQQVQPDSTGTGFWVSPDGLMVTNHHVVRGARAVVLRRESGETIKARVVAEDESRDLALLKAETSSPEWLRLSTGEARQDIEVFTQGFPMVDIMGVEAKLEKGFISSLKGFRDDPNTYQISMPVQPGNSGGALVHTSRADGGGAEMPWVVGVLVSRLNGAERVSYAIKSSVVVDFLKSVPEASALVTRPAERPQSSAVDHVRKASCLIMVKTR